MNATFKVSIQDQGFWHTCFGIPLDENNNRVSLEKKIDENTDIS